MARRAEPSTSLSLFSAAFILLLFCSGGTIIKSAEAQKTWCVAKPSSDEATLEHNLDYACGKVDCSVLQKDGPCFDPHTFISHASIAMNLYYQAHESNPSSCDFKKSAIVVITDPSFGSCKYA